MSSSSTPDGRVPLEPKWLGVGGVGGGAGGGVGGGVGGAND